MDAAQNQPVEDFPFETYKHLDDMIRVHIEREALFYAAEIARAKAPPGAKVFVVKPEDCDLALDLVLSNPNLKKKLALD